MRLITENHFKYYIRKNGKLYRVESLSFDVSAHQDSNCLGSLPNFAQVDLKSDCSPQTYNLPNLDTEDSPYTQLYVQVNADTFFQIGAVANSVNETNQIMLKRNDIALIDSTDMSIKQQYHFLASMESVKATTA